MSVLVLAIATLLVATPEPRLTGARTGDARQPLWEDLAAAWKRGHHHFPPGGFEQRQPKVGPRRYTSEATNVCGNSFCGWVDPAPLCHAAAEFASAAGLDVTRNVTIHGIRFDALDPERRIGFVLSDQWLYRPDFSAGEWTVPERPHDLDPHEELTFVEYADLLALGFRIHVATLRDFPCLDRDEFTAMVEYLGSVVDFCDDVTGRADPTLDGLLFGVPHTVKAEENAVSGDGLTVEADAVRFTVAATQPTTITVVFQPTDPWRRGDRVVPAPVTAGRITLAEYGGFGRTGARLAALRLRQSGSDAEGRIEPTKSEFFLPSWFDATHSFQIALDVEPGVYRLDRDFTVRAAP